jgi:hypothetical protein
LGRGEGSTLTESSKQAGGFAVKEQKITNKRGQREKKLFETRDLALVGRQLGVAYEGWTLLCGATYQA